jgi:hypothetical protein
MICWHWGQIGAWGDGLLAALSAAGLSLAALLWLARRAVPPAAALAALLLLPLVSVPPGVLSRHRADVAPGGPAPPRASPTPHRSAAAAPAGPGR